MNRDIFLKSLEDNKKLIDNRLHSYFDKSFKLYDPIIYSIDSGKRIRASLFLETLKMLDSSIDDEDIDFALAIEMIQAYSLIHDDLPAMDNDDWRRGKASLHKKYGEDIAILSGDALLNEASFLALDISTRNPIYIEASRYLFDHTGYKGMIEGQFLDLKRKESYDLAYLLETYERKTADLFKGSIVSAGIVRNLSNKEICKLKSFAKNLGLAYQIQDDLLEESYQEELNILNIMEESKAYDLLNNINEKAREDISKFRKNDFLVQLIDYLSKRDN